MEKIKIWVVSLWCNKTLVDTENIIWTLWDKIELVNEKDAEIVFLNTCSFLKSARDEVIENLNFLKDKKVVLIWCYTKFSKPEILDEFPQIWWVVSFKKYPEIYEILKSINEWKKVYMDFEVEEKYLEMPWFKKLTPKHFAYLKISEGCDNACAYCTIPQIRWKFRSRLPEKILNEAKILIKNWTKEIILTSQDTWYYWRDFKKDKENWIKIDFTELLKQISDLDWDFKIRFLYMYPERITDELLDLISKNEKILPYFDIPFQHASKDVLLKMNRPFMTDRIYDLVEKIRKILPNAVLRTTFITWFPWETEEDFKILKKFIEDCKFERIWVFAYSNEKWAKSYDFENQIDEETKEKRRKEIYELAEDISFENNKKLLWKDFDVFVEWYDEENDLFYWRSYREAPEVDWKIFFYSERDLEVWEKISVKIDEITEIDLIWSENI